MSMSTTMLARLAASLPLIVLAAGAGAQVLGAFACDAALILAHQEVRDAPDEVPAVQALIEALGVRGALLTADALHGQKNLRGRRPHRQRPAGPAEAQPAPLA